MDATVLEALGPTYDLLKKLLEADVLVRRSVTVWHADKIIQYSINIMLGNNESKRQKFAQVVQSYFKGPIVFSPTVDYAYSILPEASILEDKGIVSLQNGNFKLDLSKLVREGGFDVFSIQVKCKLDPALLKNIILPTTPSNGKRDGDHIVSHFQVSLDEIPSWLEVYERFEVRDLEFTHTIEQLNRSLGAAMSQDFLNKILRVARAHNAGNVRAADFSIMSKHFLNFEKEEYGQRLLASVTVDNEDFEVVGIQTKMEQFPMTESGLGPVIPGSFKITIRGSITAEEVVKKGHVRIDLSVLHEILNELAGRTELETRSLRF